MKKVSLEDSQFFKNYCSAESYPEIPRSWAVESFSQLLSDVTDSQLKLFSSEMIESGRYPVIDQGQKYIAGYTNNETLVRSFAGPVIVFGDHTRSFKLVSFPFVQGADGTRILESISVEMSDFFFHFFRSLRLPNKGYSRHYKYLKQTRLPLPPLGEQKRIVSKIESTGEKIKEIEKCVSKAEDLIKKYRESLLQKAFRGELVPQDPNDEPASKLLERIRNEREKDTSNKKKKKDLSPIKPEEIPFEIPKSWEWVRLGNISSVVRGGSPRPAGNKKYYDGDIPFLRVSDLTGEPTINVTSYVYSIKPAGLKKTRLVEPNTLMLTNSGATLGVPRIVRFQTAFNDGVAALLGIDESISKEFICYFLTTLTKKFLSDAYGSRSQGQPNLNTDIIAKTLVPLPPRREQLQILAAIQLQSSKVTSQLKNIVSLKEYSELLQASILQSAFSGQLVPQDPSEGTGHELLAKIKSEQSQITESRLAKRETITKKRRPKK